MPFNNQPEERYSRQILLQEIGMEGQQTLSQSTVAIIGLGALGSVAAELLARAGVGNLILIDRDIVEESNLQRQLLYREQDVGKSKALAAQQAIQTINSTLKSEMLPIHLNSQNISLLNNADLILDCTDNIGTRLLLNDYGKQHKKPWIYAAAIKTRGMVMPILPNGPCLRCFLTETNAETCDTVGVLNTITTSIAALQVSIALKVLLQQNVDPVLYHFDCWNPSFQTIIIKQNPSCPACNERYEFLQRSEETKVIPFCAGKRYQIQGKKHDFPLLKKRWERLGIVQEDEATLRFKNILLFKDGHALITAQSEEEALTIYSKYVGN